MEREYFDAYEEVFGAIERHVDEHGSVPTCVYVSSSLFRWLLEINKERVTTQSLAASESLNHLDSRFGSIELRIDELLSPWEILVE